MHVVQPERGWEVPIQSTVLIASAMARARPAAMDAGPPRLNGLPDVVVADRYAELIRLWSALPSVSHVDLKDLARLEALPTHRGFPAWESLVNRSGAADDPAMVAAARSVWAALGSNEYALHLRPRPRTYRGFNAGRNWIALGALGIVLIGVAAVDAHEQWGWPWWVFAPVLLGWPLIVLRLFRRHYNRLRRIGGRELPHL